MDLLFKVGNFSNLRKDLQTELYGPTPEIIESMIKVGSIGFWKVVKTAHLISRLANQIYRVKLVDTIKMIKKDGIKKAREEAFEEMIKKNRLKGFLESRYGSKRFEWKMQNAHSFEEEFHHYIGGES